jgi:DNA-binding FrmR family transcriptional regulator
MTQLQAVRAALTKVETELMREHIDHCVASAFSSGDPDQQRQKADELVTLLQRTMR